MGEYPEEDAIVHSDSTPKKGDDVDGPTESLEPQLKKPKPSAKENKRKKDKEETTEKESPFKRARKASARMLKRQKETKEESKVKRKLDFGNDEDDKDSKGKREKEILVTRLYYLVLL